MATKKQVVKKTSAKSKDEKEAKASKKTTTKKATVKDVEKNNNKSTLKKFERPELLFNQKTSKMELLKQSNYLSVSKKTNNKKMVDELPPGVRKSVEEKERIMNVLSVGQNINIEDIRKKFFIEKEPLTKKRAGELKAKRLNFFKTNIAKNKKGKLEALNYEDTNELLKEIKDNNDKKNQDKIQQIAKAGNIASKKSTIKSKKFKK